MQILKKGKMVKCLNLNIFEMKTKTIFFLLILFFSACTKSIQLKENEQVVIEQYLATLTYGKDFVKTDSGLLYYLKNNGAGNKINKNDSVTILYSGFTLKSTTKVFFADSIYFRFKAGVNTAIKGLNEAVMLCNIGASGYLIIPFKLAYSENAVENIPANSTLFIEFRIVSNEPSINKITDFYQFAFTLDSIATKNEKYIYTQTFEGIGNKVEEGNNLNIEFKLTTLNDSLIEKNNNYNFTVNSSAIPEGLNLGIQNFKQGGMGKLYIPHNYAFGLNGTSNISPFTNLIYEIRVLSKDLQVMENSDLQKYIHQTNITTQPTQSGLYYINKTAGTGDTIKVGDTVVINILGKTIANETFLKCDTCQYVINSQDLVEGVNEGIKFMQTGGKADLIVPSKLGYGANQVGNVLPYSNLIFNIEVLSKK